MPPNPESWCCPSFARMLACWEALGKPLGEKACYSLGCYQDFLSRIEKEQEERKAREQRSSDCRECQVYRDGKCEDCYNVGLHCLDGRCVTAEQYKEKSRSAIKQFVESKERERIKEEQEERRRKQENFNQQHPEQPVRQPDRYNPPPIVNSQTNQTLSSPNEQRIGRLVVKPCGDRIWCCGVCCCPSQADCNKLPRKLKVLAGPPFHPDSVWDECRNYGCWPPPHSYE